METAASVLTNEGRSNPFLGLWKSPGSENLKITERLQIKGQQIQALWERNNLASILFF